MFVRSCPLSLLRYRYLCSGGTNLPATNVRKVASYIVKDTIWTFQYLDNASSSGHKGACISKVSFGINGYVCDCAAAKVVIEQVSSILFAVVVIVNNYTCR